MFRKSLIAVSLAALASGAAYAAVTADEAKQIGTSLTAVGAEKAGNKDGTIPEYTGGLKEIPAGFKKGSGIRPSPFESEKPRMTIGAKDAAANADKLTEGTKELLKRYPNTFRLDVYPTHRVVALPSKVLANTAKNAVTTKSVNNGLGVEGMLPGVPFPIPKSGFEAMWNHLVRYTGVAYNVKYENWNVDSAGVASLATSGNLTNEFPLYDPKRTDTVAKENDPYFKVKLFYTGPARRAGEALMAIDSVNPIVQPRRAWQYLPGQRRVKLAPDLSYDTPNSGTAGNSTYSDAFVFNGAMDRFDFKLVGKKEMYVPYSGYKLMYAKDLKPALTPNHVNPEFQRWELHRVWVVEGTLKPGQRDLYSKRVFYLDEDSWVALAADQYDAKGNLYRSTFANMGVKVATLPVIALGVGIGVDYALYLLSVQLAQQRKGLPLTEAYKNAVQFTGKVVALVGVTLAAGVITWAWSPIKFQADMRCHCRKQGRPTTRSCSSSNATRDGGRNLFHQSQWPRRSCTACRARPRANRSDRRFPRSFTNGRTVCPRYFLISAIASRP